MATCNRKDFPVQISSADYHTETNLLNYLSDYVAENPKIYNTQTTANVIHDSPRNYEENGRALEYFMANLFAYPKYSDPQNNETLSISRSGREQDPSLYNLGPLSGQRDFFNFYAYANPAKNVKVELLGGPSVRIHPCGLFIRGTLIELTDTNMVLNILNSDHHFINLPFLYSTLYTGVLNIVGNYIADNALDKTPTIDIGFVQGNEVGYSNADDDLVGDGDYNDPYSYVFIESLNVSGGNIVSVNNTKLTRSNSYSNPSHYYYSNLDSGALLNTDNLYSFNLASDTWYNVNSGLNNSAYKRWRSVNNPNLFNLIHGTINN